MTRMKQMAPEPNEPDDRKRPPNHWIFQSTPARYDLSSLLVPGNTETWLVTRYGREMTEGDIVYFWQAGPESALHGWGRIVSPAPYRPDQQTKRKLIDVLYDIRFQAPIPKEVFRNHEELNSLQILRTPQGTNFRVEPQEAKALSRLLEEYGIEAPEEPEIQIRQSMSFKHSLEGHESAVLAVAITPDGQRAVSASGDRNLKVWNLKDGKEEHSLQGHEDIVLAVAITPDGQLAVSASWDDTLKVWNLMDGREEHSLRGHEKNVSAVAITPDGRRAVSTSFDNSLKVWDLKDGREERTLRGHEDAVTTVAIAPDGRRAVSTSDDQTLKVWDLEDGKEEHSLKGHDRPVTAVVITPDGLRAVSASVDSTLKVWDLRDGMEERTLDGHANNVAAIALTPDGRRAVSASDDQTLKVWNLKDGKEEHSLEGHKDWVTAVAITPDGRRAVSASNDLTLKIWNLKDGKEERTLEGHENNVTAVAITPDGQRAVSGSDDNTLKVWEIGGPLVRKEGFFIANRAIRDVWTLEDKLGHRLYARAIARPILDGTTLPPVTISIQAPWGHGKTSLMRMILEELDPESSSQEEKKSAPEKAHGNPGKAPVPERSRLEKALDWLRAALGLKADDGAGAKFSNLFEWLDEEEKEPGRNMLGVEGATIPGVWFNPLYYQNSEQVWAGLAHAILSQLTERLPSGIKREEFWLRLQFRRINKAAVRRSFHRLLLEDFLPWAALYSFASLGLGLIGALSEQHLLFTSTLFGGPFALGARHLFELQKSAGEKPLHGAFETYITEPDYRDRLGFLHLVDHDIKRALELLVGDNPIAVFIDDLDRCSPEVVGEVILAINQFISLPERKIVFVLGMDTHMVAMALEKSHGSPKKEGSVAGKGFGWQFMDKFVQLPFTIPSLSNDSARRYMKNLLSAKEEKAQKADLSAGALAKAEAVKAKEGPTFDGAQFEEKILRADTAEEITELATEAQRATRPQEREKADALLSAQASKVLADPKGEEIERLVGLALQDLEFKPRAMKRFLNEVRLLRHIDLIRNPGRNPEESRLLVVRTAHLMLNWPRVVRWLQDTESYHAELDRETSPATLLERLLEEDEELDLDQWREKVKETWGYGAADFLCEPHFFEFLKKIDQEPPRLSQIVDSGFI